MFIPWFVISVRYHIDVKTSIVVFALFLWKKILEDQITKSALQSSRVLQPSCNRIYGGLRSGLNGVPECAMFLFHYSCTYECSSICVTVLRITFSFSLSHWVSCVPCNSFEWSACAFRKDHDLQILGEHHYVGENILERPCETIYRFLHRSGFIFFWWWKAKFGLPLFHSVVWFSLPRLAADATVQPCRMPMLTTAMFIHRLGKGWCMYISSLVTVHRCHFLFLYCIFFKKVVRVISMHRDPCCLWDANKRVRTTHRCRWHAVVTESTIAYFWNALVQRVLPARAHLSKVLAVARLRALTDAIYIKKLLPFHVKIPTNTPSTATCVCKYTHHHGKVHSCVKPVACFAIRPAAFPLPNWTSNSINHNPYQQQQQEQQCRHCTSMSTLSISIWFRFTLPMLNLWRVLWKTCIIVYIIYILNMYFKIVSS